MPAGGFTGENPARRLDAAVQVDVLAAPDRDGVSGEIGVEVV